jgi:hypothetical protein
MAGISKVKGSGLATGAATESLVGIDDNATSTAITIDASENVLVGTTNSGLSSSSSATGINLKPNSDTTLARNGGAALYLNRIGTDGAITQFRKNGTTVGSIGTYTGYTRIGGTGNGGLIFRNGNIAPWNNGANTYSDAAQNLGAATARFKDLYLSGGVYLGGTAAANALDDYETGTWTPTLIASGTNPTVTYTKQEGKYTKVGNKVTLEFDLRFSAHSGGTGNALLGAFPFPNSATYSAGVFSHVQNITLPSGKTWTGLQAHQSNAYAQIKNHGSNVATGNTLLTEVSSNCILIGAITYLT